MGEPERATVHEPIRPAYYAAGPGALREWWTVLHPPYTAWHLSYVVIGAALAPRVDALRLGATLVAFFLAVGVAAHAYDELHDRPLGTRIPARTLGITATVALLGAVAIGGAGIAVVGPRLVPFVVIGPLLAVGYSLELFGGRFHTDLGFAIAWGAFPVLAAYVAQTGAADPAALLVAAAATLLSLAQRTLSTPARLVRRRTEAVEGRLRLHDGRRIDLDAATLLRPLEHTLRLCSWTTVLLACGLLASRVG